MASFFYPPLFFRGTEWPQVPAGAAVLTVPLYAVAPGTGGPYDMIGPQDAPAVVGSFSCFPYRGLFGQDAIVRVRPLGFAVGRETVTAVTGALLSTVQWILARERLDDNGAFVEATIINGDVAPGANAGLQPLFPVPIGGLPDPAPLMPNPEAVDRLVSDANVRFRVTIGDTAPLTANTVIRGVLVLALWREDRSGAIR